MTVSTADPRSPLAGRRVVLGVTGGIAAYKAVEVCRRLVDAGALVSPVLTDGALRFVGATTFSALASEPVRTSLFDDADPIPHTRLGQGADVVVVAPATARLLADYAAGRSSRPAHRHPPRHPGPGGGGPGHAHRDVGAPGRAGEPRHPAPAGASASSRPRRGAWPAATSAPVAWPTRRDRRGRGRGRPRARRTSPASGCWSPPAAPASPSTRSASSATAPRASRATRSPPRPRRGARPSPWSPPPTGPLPPGVEVVRVETAAEMHRAVCRAGGPRRRGGHGRRGRRLPPGRGGRPQDQEGRGRARGPAGADRRHPRRPRRGASAQVRPWSASPPRPATWSPATPPTSCAARASTSSSPTTSAAPGAGFEHDTNRVVLVSRSGMHHDVPLSDKRTIARAVLDAVVALRRDDLAGAPDPVRPDPNPSKETNP